MKKGETPRNEITWEVGMEAIYHIDLSKREAWLNVKWLGTWQTILEFSFDEFYDIEKIKARLERKAEAYYDFLDS